MNKNCHNQTPEGIYASCFGRSCRYGFFGRRGGHGSVPFDSRNVSYGVGDVEKIVSENRKQVQKELGCSFLLSAKQVHGDGIYCLTEPMDSDREVESVDALITDRQGVGLMIQQADCQAVLLFDPKKNVAAAVHCGWRGSVINILGKVVSRMISGFGVYPEELLVAVSPSLGPCCAEFINYKKELPPEFRPFMVGGNHFNFWQISKNQLVNAGVMEENITVTGSCTCCSKNYFSYRRSCRLHDGVTGRNCSVIVMKKAADGLPDQPCIT